MLCKLLAGLLVLTVISHAGGERADAEASHVSAAAASTIQHRQQTYRELPLYSRGMKRGPSWRVFPRTRTLCKLLAGLVALTVVFHAASCGFFFCIRFPRALEFPHDMYHDIRDIYILAGKLPKASQFTQRSLRL